MDNVFVLLSRECDMIKKIRWNREKLQEKITIPFHSRDATVNNFHVNQAQNMKIKCMVKTDDFAVCVRQFISI